MPKTLVLAPHADDAEFGLGGYLRRMTKEPDHQLHVVICAEGSYVASTGGLVTEATRKAETAAAMTPLGVTDFKFPGLFKENEGSEQVGFADLVRRVDWLIGASAYDELFVRLPSFNQDHTALYRAAETALRPGRFRDIKRVWAYEYPGNCWGPEPPRWGRCYVTLSHADVVAKHAALREHQSQTAGRIGALSVAGAMALLRQRGSEVGAEYAELFYLMRQVV